MARIRTGDGVLEFRFDRDPFIDFTITVEQDRLIAAPRTYYQPVNEAWWQEYQAKLSAESDRAWQLLVSYLTPAQKRSLKAHGEFAVTGSRGGKFRVRHTWTEHLKPVKGKQPQRVRYCIHPDGAPPYGDRMLAVKLLLETNEPAFFATARYMGVKI
jgi:hypothetical protein